MKILPNFDLTTIQHVITTDFPDLNIEKITLINNGWDNMVVEINNDLIFRFPKDGEANFDVEVKILDVLKDKISIQIPQVEFLGKSYTYMEYRKIQGNDLTAKIFDSLNDKEKEKLVFDLANFLAEIHSVISPDMARNMGVKDQDLASDARLIQSVLPDKMSDKTILDFAETTVAEYERIIGKKIEPVFLYNDLHTENMAFDVATKKLNGVFDFGDILVGDVHMDFHQLYKFNPYVMKAVAEKYQELTGRNLNLRRMVIYGRITELSDLAELIDQPESTIYKNAIMRIKKWSLEIDLFKKSHLYQRYTCVTRTE